MDWRIVNFKDGPYEMNAEGLARLIRTWAHAAAVEENSQIESVSSGWYVTSLPNITAVKTDWPAVRKQREIFASQMGDEFQTRMSWGMTGKEAIDFLQTMVDNRDGCTDTVLQMQRSATKTSMKAIRGAVSTGEDMVRGLTAIERVAAETELVLVTGVATGLIGAPALAAEGAWVSASKAATVAFGITAGSVMKGVTKFGETERVGLGLLECGVELAFNTISFATLSANPVSKPVKAMMGLLFAFMKKSMKELPVNAFASPEDLASKRKKSLTQMWTEIVANTPSGIIGDLVKGLTNDFRIIVPAVVILKLIAAAEAKKAGQAAVARNAPAGRGPAYRGPVMFDPAVLRSIRETIHHTRSTPLMDSAQPVENFVSRFVMRPIMSQ